jgi:nitrate/TMAO reductase-like tetraheme cytochrome c subunit
VFGLRAKRVRGLLLALTTVGVVGLSLSGFAQKASTVSRSPHGDLNIACQNCHTSVGWKPIRAVPEFDHNQTKYPLRGLHQGVACTQCHAKPVFSNVGTNCADCHADIHRRQMGANCEQCHSVKGWNIVLQRVREHENRFPLVGGHAGLDCADCHKSAAVGQFQGLSTQCYSCHQKTYQQTNAPNHLAAKFPTQCEQCHNINNWFGVNFDHASVGFPLTGGHANLQCDQCHKGGNFNLTSTACVGCHLSDFQKASNPNHVSLGLPQTCENCHTTAAWSPATFNHDSVGFPLTGGHANLTCDQCHKNGNFQLTSTACVGCHINDFNKTSNPNHAAAGIPQQCEMCHTTAGWQPASFDHSKTAFPLTGAHAKVQCGDCHKGGNYNLTTAACYSCHQQDYQGTNNPNHASVNFPQQCEVCHSTSTWTPATFNHNNTSFPLTGKHTSVACTDCHKNNNYTSIATNCYGCHSSEYAATNSPNHVTAGFPQTCELCHTTSNWTSATFNHASTGWPLTGAHGGLQCSQCHGTSTYNLTNTACNACHLPDYQKTNNPNHASAGFPQQCDVCHNTTAWTPATFNHNNTSFPLTGAHTSVACANCHLNNNYTSIPTDCYSCHKDQYNQTNNPNHIAAGFPNTCAVCHTTTSWSGATFNHTYFPTNHGNANGVCATCHTNPSDYSVFQCTNCHTKSNTDGDHRGVSGYVYNSVNCYQCHRNGRGG